MSRLLPDMAVAAGPGRYAVHPCRAGIEAVIAWLDAGKPDPGLAGARINALARSIIEAARGQP